MTIVVGYSPQPDGEAAYAAALRRAQETGESLVAVNATRGDAPVDRRFASDDDVARIGAAAAAAGVDLEVRHCIAADVGLAVLEAAGEAGVSLVVVGVRRRSPVGKLLLGSVAQTVILQAEVPVLCVKPTG